MYASKVTSKGQVTIPRAVRERLDVQPGDTLAYELQADKSVLMRKMKPFDVEWHREISATLADEWNSPEDAEAFDDL